MAESLRDSTLDEALADFLDQQDLQRQTGISQREVFARRLLYRMSAGEPFDIDTFIFVASLGEPKRYEQQAEMLRTASQLPRGRIVGISYGNRLGCIGAVGGNPLLMKARVGSPRDPEIEQHYNRNMGAWLLLTTLVRDCDVPRNKLHQPLIRIEETHLEDTPFAANLLWNMSEPKTYESEARAFYEPKELIVGAEAIIGFVTENNDSNGQQQIAEFMTRLTVSHLGSLAVAQ